MKYPVKQIFWSLAGGALSALAAMFVGIPFWLASIIILILLVIVDYMVHIWRMHKFTDSVGRNCFAVRDYVDSLGNKLVLGTRQELLEQCGVAYQLYGFHVRDPRFDHYCLRDSRTEREIISKYNVSRSRNPLYLLLEFLF